MLINAVFQEDVCGVCACVCGYLYVNISVCVLHTLFHTLEICVCVCCLDPHLQLIHQSVLSPCFGSPRLSVKDITRCQICHASAIRRAATQAFLNSFACLPSFTR